MSDYSSSSYRSAHGAYPPDLPTNCGCWCGNDIITYISKTKENPYRIFYRCSISLKRPSESHFFKWVYEASVEEIKMVDAKVKRIEEDVTDLRHQHTQNLDLQKEMFDKLEEKLGKKLEEKLMKKIEDDMGKTTLKTISLLFVIGITIVWLWERI
ncbi:uncharacterized protein At4g04775-like [Capsella rubella]|uniref:uncharacterized protein At4g04775-like n=1 Tax=Capsella rubella TaxID=81985 RepID=UPI000CD59689|nr:uncharacterized protein At4g04775-like [Capsella rubella]